MARILVEPGQPAVDPGRLEGLRADGHQVVIETSQAFRRRRAAERHHLLVVQAGVGIGEWTPDGRVVFMNALAAQYLGAEPDALEGRSAEELFGPERGAEYRRRIALTAEQRTAAEYEDRVDLPVGVRWFHSFYAPIIDDHGRLEGVQIVSRDVTELRHAADELRRREILLRKVFEFLPVGLWFADREGRLLMGNPAGVRIWGGEPKVGPPEYGVFRARRLPDGQEIAPDDWALAHTIRDGVTVRDELLEIDAFDGRTRTVLNYTAPVTDDDGRLQGAVVVNVDVTEQRATEAQLRQSQRLDALGTLAGGVAHEVNNPVMGILNYAQLLLDRADRPDDVRRYAAEIGTEAERIAGLVRNLLAFARREPGPFEAVRPADLVEGTLSLVRAVLRRDAIRLVVEVSRDLPPVRCRSAEIQQVLMNLVTNARDALGEAFPGEDPRKRIVVRAALAPPPPGAEAAGAPRVRLVVENPGLPIPPAVRERLFEPFFTTKPRDRGTGLGLSISRRLVEDHGGAIEVECDPSGVTRFSVELPVWRSGSEPPLAGRGGSG